MTTPLPLHARAVELATADIGNKETPLGSNSGAFVQDCQRYTWLGGYTEQHGAPAHPTTTRWPWCVAFCIREWVRAGLTIPYRGAGAYDYLNWAVRNRWAVPSSQAVPGDAVVWNLGAGHMSMLAQPVTGTTVHTIDGNVSDRVDRRTRPLSQVRGFIHIPEKPAVVTMPKPPVFEVVTSESGSKVIYVSGARAVGRKLSQILERHPNGVVIRRKRK